MEDHIFILKCNFSFYKPHHYSVKPHVAAASTNNKMSMLLVLFLLLMTLTSHTLAHTGRGKPTLKDAERFRNGFTNHDLMNDETQCDESLVTIIVMDANYLLTPCHTSRQTCKEYSNVASD